MRDDSRNKPYRGDGGMKCRDKTIKEMLPVYLTGGLELDVRRRVEEHLNACGDCLAETDILRAVSVETVPDPGEDFWASMPDRIRRMCLEEMEKKGARRGLWERLRPHEWAWAIGAAAAALVLVITLWPGGGTVEEDPAMDLSSVDYVYEYEETGSAESLEGLEDDELDALASWAGDELDTLVGLSADDLTNGMEGGFYEELSDMDDKELERFSGMLDKAKQEV
jgi:hypothetical protein